LCAVQGDTNGTVNGEASVAAAVYRLAGSGYTGRSDLPVTLL
jgi:hypothetical protein